jgi:hypothetical protein
MDRKQEANLEYNIDYRNVKHPRLEFKTGTLLLILPKSYKSEKEVLEKYRKWIGKKELIIRTALQEANTRSLNQDRTDKELRNLVHTLARNFQRELDTYIAKIYFRKMKTKWASHSQNNNLTINTLLKYLPQPQIEYVTYHELIHAKQGKKHDKNFWNLINRKFKNYQTLENDLLTYWFLIQQNLRKPETMKRF